MEQESLTHTSHSNHAHTSKKPQQKQCRMYSCHGIPMICYHFNNCIEARDFDGSCAA